MGHIRELHPSRGSQLSGMDVRRDAGGPRARVPWLALGGAALLGIAVFVASLKPAAEVVDRDLLVIATVRQGPMVREVHGWGALVPDRTQLVRAAEPGIVEAVYVTPGQAVRGGDRIVELRNSEIELAVEKAAQKFAAARAGMIALSREQADRRLALEASIADARVAFLTAEDELEAMLSRAPRQAREIEMKRAQERLDARARRLTADEERLALIHASTEQQMAVRRDELRWVESILDSERARLAALTLRAAGDGVVERVFAGPGERAAGGDVLAELQLSERMKAVVDVYASEAAEIAPGQSVSIETAGGRLEGTVNGIDPAADPRLLRVAVALDGDPPAPSADAREVKARIHVGTLEEVVFVERPVYAGSDGWTTVFRLAADSASAERVKVRLGRGSVDRIEVLSGLEPGDRVVVSDISGFDEIDGFEIQ